MMFPLAVFAAESAANPREAVFVDPKDTRRAAAGDQFFVEPQRFRQQPAREYALKSRQPHEPHAVADTERFPEWFLAGHAIDRRFGTRE